MQGGFFNQLFQWYASLYLKNYFEQVRFSTLFLDLYIPNVTKRNFYLNKLISEDQLANNFNSMLQLVRSKLNDGILDENLQDIGINKKIGIGFFQDINIVEKSWQESLVNIQKYNFLKNSMVSSPSDYIAVHVRLSDYLTNKKTREFHGLTKPEYFLKSINYFFDTTDCRKVKLVSDSPKNLGGVIEVLLKNKIKPEVVSSNFSADFLTLTLGRAIVMSNSSFSWWAAFLAQKFRKTSTIVPYPWFSKPENQPTNLIPDTWIKITRELY